MKVAARRLARVVGTGSPSTVVRAARREVWLRREEARLERALAAGGPVVVGPYLGEVGYEFLFWRPYVLRFLRERRIDPARVTVVGRGGSGAWYAPVAAHSVDAFDHVAPEAMAAAAAARPFGSPKQHEIDDLDRELLAAAAPPGATVVHPLFMYWRSRYLWEGVVDPADAPRRLDYEQVPPVELPADLEDLLPDGYVAVKAYFNECVPESAAAAVGAVVEAVAERAPVVLLSTPVAADTHGSWQGPAGMVDVSGLLRPSTNLAHQVEVVRRARALVSTYGGFSYAGPYTGVPTVAFWERREDNPNHERALRAGFPDASYVRTAVDPAPVLAALDL